MLNDNNFSVMENSELKDYFKENELRVLEGYDFSKDRILVTISKENCNSELNLSMDEDGDNIEAEVVSNDSVVEKFSTTTEDESSPEEEIKKIVDAYLVICDYDETISDDSKTNDNDEEKEIILSEEVDNDITRIPESLSSVGAEVKNIGDKLKSISGMSNDVDMISIIMDIANNAYTLVIDINDAIETWKELMEEKISEEPEEAE